jgi:hypothetical protein
MKRMAVLMEVHVQQAAAHLFQQAGVRNQTPVRGAGRTMSTDSLNTPKKTQKWIPGAAIYCSPVNFHRPWQVGVGK